MKTTPRLDMNYTAKHFIYFKRLFFFFFFILSVFNFCKNSPVRVNRRLVAIAKIKKKRGIFISENKKKTECIYLYMFVCFFFLSRNLYCKYRNNDQNRTSNYFTSSTLWTPLMYRKDAINIFTTKSVIKYHVIT